MACGGVAAGKSRRRRCATRSKPFAMLPTKNSPPQMAAVVAVASSVKTHAQHSLIPRAALGEHRCDVRPMMLDRVALPPPEFQRVHEERYCG